MTVMTCDTITFETPSNQASSNELKITSNYTLNYENANDQMWNKCNFNVILIVFNLP